MIYSDFISKCSKYLKSVRILKNYVSFDMAFPSTWTMLKNMPQGLELLESEGNESRPIYSLVCENKKELIVKKINYTYSFGNQKKGKDIKNLVKEYIILIK